MILFRMRTTAMLASAAALSLVATPALANHGWGGGYQQRDRDDTGAWVVGGIIGIGMIAAIASAASKSKREREVRERDYRGDDYDRGDDTRRDDYRYGNRSDDRGGSYSASPRGIDAAVDRCVGEVERGRARVETVDSVNRDANGWRVAGRINGGPAFDCAIDNEGRIRSVNIDGRAAG